MPEVKTCPKCAEEVLAAAQVCKHCRYRFTPRAWVPYAVVAVIVVVLLGLALNQMRVEQERERRNSCFTAYC